MTGELLQDLDQKQGEDPITPPWIVWSKGAKARREWFEAVNPIVQELARPHIENMVNNMLWYTGEFEKTQEYRTVVPGRSEQVIERKVLPRIFNHLYDITEQRISRLARYKPSFDVFPINREENDRRTARLMKIAISAVKRRVNMDFLIQEVERWTAIFASCYVGVEWNKYIGDKRKGSKSERIGDVDVYLKQPWTVFLEPKGRYQDCTWAIDIWKICHLEEAKSLFGSSKIKSDGKTGVFTFSSNDMNEKRPDEVVLYRLIQLPCKDFPEGGIAYFVGDECVDEETPYPYSHGDFPWERHTDIDVPGRLYPISFYQQMQPMQHAYNRFTSVMIRNMLLVGHPHVLLPEGSAKIEAFANAPTVIKYNPIGGAKPEIITWGSVPREFFELRKEIREEMRMIGGIQGISSGEPPAGVRAASMLRFYEEQEEQRASTQIIKHNEFIRRLYRKIGAIIGDFYPAGPDAKERLVRVLGKENEYIIDCFGETKVSSEYDVEIINATGFSETMSGRLEEVQMITQMEAQKGVQIISSEQIQDVLETKNPQKAYDIMTASTKTAELYCERFLDGRKVPEPELYWDLIVHWRTTMVMMNSPVWENVPVKYKKKAEAHVMMLERLMEDKSAANQAFSVKLQMLDGYPAFWSPTPVLAEEGAPKMMPGEAMPPMPQDIAAAAAAATAGANAGAAPGLPPVEPGLPPPNPAALNPAMPLQ